MAESPPSTANVRVAADASLHARLLERDPAAPADLASEFLAPLVTWLRRMFPVGVPDDVLETVAIDLILNLAQRPEQYDPARSSLVTYLHMAARRDVRNALSSLRTRARRLVPLENVELAVDARNDVLEHNADPADVVVRQIPAVDPESLAHIRARFDATEWQVVQLMLEGERRTAAYAAILQLTNVSEFEQATAVKRVKDRLTKRLQRLAPTINRDE